MEILCLGDIHASERPPSSCTDSYNDDIFGLLLQTQQIANAREVAAVVWAGDVFHSKAPSRSSHRLVQRFLDHLSGYECPVYVVPGNHDVQHDRMASLAETQPLGVLIRSGMLRLLNGWESYTGPFSEGEAAGLPIYGVPWLQEWTGETVSAALEGWRRQVSGAGTGAVHPLVVTHAPLYPPGQELEFEHFPARQWQEAMGGRGACYYGHVHEWHGIWRVAHVVESDEAFTSEVGGVTFCNPGALSRGSLHEHNLTRTPACAVWDSETGTFEEIPLAARPPEQVFRLQENREITDMQGRLEAFLAQVGSSSLEVMSVESVVHHLRSLGLDPADLELAEELLAEVSA
jgi:Calcineurin-like phosphoesterase